MAKELKFRCNLKEIMDKHELSASELHRRTGIALTTVRTMTNGGVLDRIDRSSTQKILTGIGCQFEDLWSILWEDNK